MKSKKVWIIILSIVIVIILALGGFFLYQYFKPVTLSASDGSFTVTIPGTVKFETRSSTDADYTLDLYSVDDKMFFNTTSAEKTGEINLLDAVNQERVNVAQYHSSTKDISEASEIAIKDYKAYGYTYQYHDIDFNDDIYCQIVWIETDTHIYVLDLEVVASNREKYEPIFQEIISSFTETIS